MWSDLKKIRHISLKWKLLIPFLFLPAALTLLLSALGISAQQHLLRQQEEKRMHINYSNFRMTLERRLELSQASAALVASNPITQKALADENRDLLYQHFMPVFNELKAQFGLDKLHFHLFPARSFLRVHRPDQCGEDMSRYRPMIMAAYKNRSLMAGLEFGDTGFGLRGVAPVYYQDKLVGSVEAAFSLKTPLLNLFKQDFACDLSVYLPSTEFPGTFRVLATTTPTRTLWASAAYQEALDRPNPVYLTVRRDKSNLAVLVGQLRDFQGQTVALVELSMDRSGVLSLTRQYAILFIGVGVVTLALALIFVWRVSTLFLAPIGNLVDQARKIAAGERVPTMEVTARDEFGSLAVALNKMLSALEESRYKLQNQAQDLEARVRERTDALVRSEEKFRTLVENIPLVVYRLEADMIRTFVSPHIEKLTGWSTEDLVGGPAVWSGTIHPLDRQRVLAAKQRCLQLGRSCDIEYRLQDHQGQEVEILDHAEPVYDADGRVLYLEGYMLDIRERKHLQDQIVQAEELKTLSEISSRLAHEFRNPLSVVGLCSRRLAKTLDDHHPGVPYIRILMEQVGRLEQILNMIQMYIKPMGLKPEPIEAEKFLNEVARKAAPFISEQEIALKPDIHADLPQLNIDVELMERALLNLIRNAAYQMPARGMLVFSAAQNGRALEIKLVYPAGYLSDDQLRHFFYPFTTEDADASLVDLPLVPVIVHKHNGIITVGREGMDLVSVTVVLPYV